MDRTCWNNKLYKAICNIDAEVVIIMFDEAALAVMQQASLDLRELIRRMANFH